jgi:hypothetical protein
MHVRLDDQHAWQIGGDEAHDQGSCSSVRRRYCP